MFPGNKAVRFLSLLGPFLLAVISIVLSVAMDFEVGVRRLRSAACGTLAQHLPRLRA